MLNKTIAGKKGGEKGNHMYGAHSLEATQKHAAIKPEKKKKKERV